MCLQCPQVSSQALSIFFTCTTLMIHSRCSHMYSECSHVRTYMYINTYMYSHGSSPPVPFDNAFLGHERDLDAGPVAVSLRHTHHLVLQYLEQKGACSASDQLQRKNQSVTCTIGKAPIQQNMVYYKNTTNPFSLFHKQNTFFFNVWLFKQELKQVVLGSIPGGSQTLLNSVLF